MDNIYIESNCPFASCSLMYQPAIILVNPQINKNIGSASRTMLNFGLVDLRLVNPPKQWLCRDTIKLSAGSFNILEKAKVFHSIEDATSDINLSFSTTSTIKNSVKNIYTPSTAIEYIKNKLIDHRYKIAFIFGQEKQGLSARDLSISNMVIKIPTNPKFHSLNISHSIAILAYEWNKSLGNFIPKNNIGLNLKKSVLATGKQIYLLFKHIESILTENNFFPSRENEKEYLKQDMLNIISRTNLTEKEVKILYGIINSIKNNKN
jgi:tRNA/rRNA methyltransferase